MVDQLPSKPPTNIGSGDPESLPGGTGASHPAALEKKRGSKILLIIFALCLILTAWFIPPVYWLLEGPIIVTRYTKKNGETRVLVGPKEKNWTPFHKMSRHFVNAVIAAEDGKFFQHNGLDFEEIRRSYELNIKKNRYARGGSTITQQLVKMAFLGREKTLLRKAREAAGALVLEAILPKEKILEWYLNLVELGDGVYGIASGSQHYFKTKPELLTIEQSVHLALVLPSPNGWSKGLRNQNLTHFGHRRFSSILLRMRQSGTITSAQWMTAISRGNFGKPIQGYASLLAREEELKKGSSDQNTLIEDDCDNSPECDELLEEDSPDTKTQTTLNPPRPSSPQGNSPSSLTNGTNPPKAQLSPLEKKPAQVVQPPPPQTSEIPQSSAGETSPETRTDQNSVREIPIAPTATPSHGRREEPPRLEVPEKDSF